MSCASCYFAHHVAHLFNSVTRRSHAATAAIKPFRRFESPRWSTRIASHTKQFSTTRCRNGDKDNRPAVTAATTDSLSTASNPAQNDPKVHPVADEQLPSHRRNQQWTFSKRFHALMDQAVANLAQASQRINNYTGTDYSGIEALRREITEQEQLVRARYTTLQQAKAELNAAQEKRTTSATDLVALLERKHSWTSPDLEKYMSLVRSEHTNDKAVQTAKESMDRAEQALEDARIRLEKRERMQYHEEQIWSDTIRRNSTWVTIGLMGLNIAILLFNLVAIEPWRRRRLVREVRSALEEKSMAPVAIVEATEITNAPIEAPLVENRVIEPVNTELLESPDTTLFEVVDQTSLNQTSGTSSSSSLSEDLPVSYSTRIKDYVKGFFSDKIVSLQMIELTAIAIQSAAGGATVAWLLVLLMLIPY